MRINNKKIVICIIDVIYIIGSYLFAIFLKNNFILDYAKLYNFKIFIICGILVYLVIFYLFKIYNNIWQYAGLDDYITVTLANAISFLLTIIIDQILGTKISIATIIIGATFTYICTVGMRIMYRLIRNKSIFSIKKSDALKNILIIGAGYAGKLLINEIKQNHKLNYNIVGLIDDDKIKIGQIVNNIKVLGDTQDIPTLTEQYDIQEIILAIPSLDNLQRKRILDVVSTSNVRMKTLPNIPEIMNDGLNIKSIRDVEITDLLGRKEISIDLQKLQKYFDEKTVLVTGGGGSIGSELCRQIASLNPKKLVIVDIYENNAYDIQNELLRKYPILDLEVLITSVRDRVKITDVFEKVKPNYVFHAAAHKHVPLMETSPGEAVKNNVFGTLNCAYAADKVGVERFLLISTDKAVNPTNVMGATKRMCEMVVQTYNQISKNTEFVAVRFGNVLGSNGSVIPLFKRQIAEGGPLTVTHRDITRYFMTIPEAVQLVLTAGTMAKGGEIFVLDMGEPVKIYDLATNLIKLSGYEPNKDIKIEISGLRPGEKLYEELLMAEEGLQKTENSLIYIGKPSEFEWQELLNKLNHIKSIVDDPKSTNELIKDEVAKIVTTYKRTN